MVTGQGWKLVKKLYNKISRTNGLYIVLWCNKRAVLATVQWQRTRL